LKLQIFWFIKIIIKR